MSDREYEKYTHDYVMKCIGEYYSKGYNSLSKEDQKVVRSYLNKFGLTVQYW